MVFQLAVVIIIPIILGIAAVPPFDLPEEPPQEITIPDDLFFPYDNMVLFLN